MKDWLPAVDNLKEWLPDWGLAAIIVSTLFLLLWFIKRIVLNRLTKFTARTQIYYDDLVVRSLHGPLTLIVLVISISMYEFLLRQFDVEGIELGDLTQLLSRILLIFAGVLFFNTFLSGLLERQAQRSSMLQNSLGITTGLTRGLVFGIGALVLLGTLGISITPIIASLGITSLAVALALQPTLENFFSGVQLVIDRPIRVGDFIELESGQQGFVQRIGWRSTWVKMLPNNVVIIPNSQLSQSRIINYYYPEKEMSVLVEVGVHYDSDLEQVEQLTVEVARDLMHNHDFGVPSYDPFMVYHTFDNSSINFTVIIRAREFTNQYLLKSAFIKALHKRYNEAGIVIPFPISAVNFSQEQPQSAQALDTALKGLAQQSDTPSNHSNP